MELQDVIGGVPDYQAFLTVDEMDESTRRLAEAYPDAVTVFEAGRSRNGHPILCIRIGDGPKNALCYACPHPNEPIGAMTMEYFSLALAENERLRRELGFTWYIVKCSDPDGVRLNEKWFKGPFNIYNYTRHYYRPIGSEQVEWTFPIDYKELHFHHPLPETEALMKIIDETKPAFIYSLHNAGLCGAYWYITHDLPEIYEGLHEAVKKQEMVLSLGEPEVPSSVEYAPAVFSMFGATEFYDYMEKFTGKAPQFDCGTTSSDYALSKGDCVTLLTELPYFFDDRIQDLSETEWVRKDLIYRNVEMCDVFFTALENMLNGIRPYIGPHNPFIKFVDQSLQMRGESGIAKKKWADSSPDFAKPATVSQVFDNLVSAKFHNGLVLGLLVRACEYELDALERSASPGADGRENLRKAQEAGLDMLVRHCGELERELNYTAIPIQKLVRIQLECGLIVARHISRNR